MPLVAWILAFVVVFAAAAVQGVVGIGFAMMSVPLLALIDPRLAPVPVIVLALPLTVTMAWRERGHVEPRQIGWILVGRIPGALLGVALLAVVTQRSLDLALAVIVLAAVAIIGTGYVVARNPFTEFGAGTFSGVTGLVAGMGGPPMALLYAGERGPVARSNLAVVFTVGLAVSLTARALSGNIAWSDVGLAAVLFPSLLAGYVLSGRVKGRVDRQQLRYGILIVSTIGAAGLLIRALT